MIKNVADLHWLGQQNLNSALKRFGEWNKGLQSIATDLTDYTRRSLEDSSATFEKLLSAKSVEQALEIQTGYTKRTYDGYMHQLSKIGGMYAKLVNETYKPVWEPHEQP